MIAVSISRKFKIIPVPISDIDSIKTFDLHLPSGTALITGIQVTTDVAGLGNLGRLTLQSNDRTDIFISLAVNANELQPADEVLMGIDTDDLEMQPEWVSGKIAQSHEIAINGDTTLLHCIYRTYQPANFMLKVYLQYQEREETDKEEESNDREFYTELYSTADQTAGLS